MTIANKFRGAVKALLSGSQDGASWEDDFDLTAAALPRSFIAVLAYIPLGFVPAMAVLKYNDNTQSVPYGTIAITLGLIVLTFPLIAYVLCMVFDKTDRFRPWVIVRNWTMLFTLSLMALVFGLYLVGLFPFFVVYVLALGVYLGTLVIDIRLAWRIAGFDWIGAVFAGILISAATMMVVSMVVSQKIV